MITPTNTPIIYLPLFPLLPYCLHLTQVNKKSNLILLQFFSISLLNSSSSERLNSIDFHHFRVLKRKPQAQYGVV